MSWPSDYFPRQQRGNQVTRGGGPRLCPGSQKHVLHALVIGGKPALKRKQYILNAIAMRYHNEEKQNAKTTPAGGTGGASSGQTGKHGEKTMNMTAPRLDIELVADTGHSDDEFLCISPFMSLVT